MHLYPIDGAVHRVAKDATAWNARDATFSMVIAGIDSDPTQADDPANLFRVNQRVPSTPPTFSNQRLPTSS